MIQYQSKYNRPIIYSKSILLELIKKNMKDVLFYAS